MEKLHSGEVLVGEDDILAFACVRDEALRLPWFLEYHRRAGVDRFFVVDNGSSDGTTEYLKSQPDVVPFYTEDSYAESRCGLDWTNELLERYAPGHWALTVDADELLVYPGCERVGLRQLTRYLDSVAADALVTMLLDMYSGGAIRSTSYSPGRPFLEVCPFFDPDSYATLPSEPVPLRGGPRERAFWQGYDRQHPAPYLPKYPLIKWRAGRVYEASTHVISDVEPAALTGALLHFKFFGDFPARVALETERQEHFAGARQYAAYSEVMSQKPDLSLHHERSVRYRDSLQLAELGILKMPESYRRLVLPGLPEPAGGRGGATSPTS